jgi:hypothetical protein
VEWKEIPPGRRWQKTVPCFPLRFHSWNLHFTMIRSYKLLYTFVKWAHCLTGILPKGGRCLI